MQVELCCSARMQPAECSFVRNSNWYITIDNKSSSWIHKLCTVPTASFGLYTSLIYYNEDAFVQIIFSWCWQNSISSTFYYLRRMNIYDAGGNYCPVFISNLFANLDGRSNAGIHGIYQDRQLWSVNLGPELNAPTTVHNRVSVVITRT